MTQQKEIKVGPEICIAENREIEVNKNLDDATIANYVWEKCRPLINSFDAPMVSARKIQLLRKQLKDQKQNTKDSKCPDFKFSTTSNTSFSSNSDHKKRSTSVLFSRISQEYSYDTNTEPE